MAYDFPSSPSVGQLFPTVNPLWKWDGTKWAAYITAATGGGAPLNSPVFTGDPQAPTPAVNDNDTSIATTAYVIGQASASGDGTPAMDGTAARGTAIHWARADHIHPTDTSRAPLASPVFTGDPQAPTPATADNDTSIATTAFVKAQGYLGDAPSDGTTYGRKNAAWAAVTGGGAAVIRGLLQGLALSTAGSSTTFTVAAGVACDTTNAQMMTLASSLNKTTGAWAVGTGNGGLDTGTIANNTWYHAWLIQRTDLTVVDALVSLSASTPTMPANYTFKRRIGSMRTNASGQWTAFTQIGDEFLWSVEVTDVNNVNFGTTPTLQVLMVPTGVNVKALIHMVKTNTASGGSGLNAWSPIAHSGSPTTNCYTIVNPNTGQYQAGDAQVWTNTSAQIYLSDTSAASNQDYVSTYGWIDRRGRDA